MPNSGGYGSKSMMTRWGRERQRVKTILAWALKEQSTSVQVIDTIEVRSKEKGNMIITSKFGDGKKVFAKFRDKEDIT